MILLPGPDGVRPGITTGGCCRFAWLIAAAADAPTAAALADFLVRAVLDFCVLRLAARVCLRLLLMMSSRAGTVSTLPCKRVGATYTCPG